MHARLRPTFKHDRREFAISVVYRRILKRALSCLSTERRRKVDYDNALCDTPAKDSALQLAVTRVGTHRRAFIACERTCTRVTFRSLSIALLATHVGYQMSTLNAGFSPRPPHVLSLSRFHPSLPPLSPPRVLTGYR